jgi:hypothetical protein
MTDQPPRRERGVPQQDSDPEWLLYDEDWLADDEVFAVEPAVPDEPTPTTFREWLVAAVLGLLDVQFKRAATRTLLPLVYVLGLMVSVAVPVLLTVVVFQFSTVLGLLFLIFVAPLLGLTIAATVRLVLEFLVNTTKLAGLVGHITVLSDDLMRALNDMAGPMNSLSGGFKAVQFWRRRPRD